MKPINQKSLSIIINSTLMIIFFTLFTACSQQSPQAAEVANTPTLTVPTEPSMVVASPSPIMEATSKTATPSPEVTEEPRLWVSQEIPQAYLDGIKEKWKYPLSASRQESTFSISAVNGPTQDTDGFCAAEWIYAVVAPFPTVADEITYNDLQQAWFGKKENMFGSSPLLLSQETFELFKSSWGVPALGGIQVVNADDLLETAWRNRPAWAIVPFEQLEPRWKVIALDGMSPLDATFDADSYPLTFHFCLRGEGQQPKEDLMQYRADLQATNREADRITSLVLTGTTALVRNLAYKMEVNGITYPAEKISKSLQSADILHISNEASFYADCPPAVPVFRESRFCSNPRYMELLKYIGADVIELTGNHLFDWGKEPFLETLELYRENDLPVYGGGIDLEQARQPVLFEHNGNKVAFIGCSPSGPANVWATDSEPGTATCDFDWIAQEIHTLNQAGYQVVFTFQHLESDDYVPHSSQRVDFSRVAEEGAEIVSGSQSHFPQAMTFVQGRFIHYGLGNTFFDQMEPLKRNQFVDRHILYNGRHISTVLLTNVLEDYSQPRPMLPEEREKFLEKIFSASVW